MDVDPNNDLPWWVSLLLQRHHMSCANANQNDLMFPVFQSLSLSQTRDGDSNLPHALWFQGTPHKLKNKNPTKHHQLDAQHILPSRLLAARLSLFATPLPSCPLLFKCAPTRSLLVKYVLHPLISLRGRFNSSRQNFKIIFFLLEWL